MKVTLKTWNKSRVGSVILFVLLTLFFGYAAIVIFVALLSGNKEFREWPYLISLFFPVVFAWALYFTLSPKHQYCMDVVKGEMSFKELKQSVEAEEYFEPLAFGPYYYEDENEWRESEEHMLVSESWVLLGHDMENPLCIPKSKVIKVTCERDVQESVGPGHPARDGYTLMFEIENGKKFVTSNFSVDKLDDAEKMMREHFPGVMSEGLLSSHLDESET